MKRTAFILSLLLLIVLWSTAAPLSFNESFSEGMVLQRQMKINIWGTASPNTTVTVELQEQKSSAKSDSDGHWKLQIGPLQAGGPYRMKALSGQETIVLDNLYVGEVWIAGGQSNMGFLLSSNLNAQEHIATADNPNIRFLIVPQKYYPEHRTKEEMVWQTATPANVGKLSAVAYFFARRLQPALGVPVGIIACYKGGTPAEAWMSQSTLLQDNRHRPIVERYETMLSDKGDATVAKEFEHYNTLLRDYYQQIKSGNKEAKRPTEPMGPMNPKRPYGLHDNMLRRIMPLTSRGTIWYQGEANAPRAEQYQTLFPALITEWRKEFENPDMYFYFVQLSNYDHPSYNYPAWAELREAQTLTTARVKGTAMALSIDYGEKNDIHPRQKLEVGNRLAALALNNIYGQKQVCQGPRYRSMKSKGNRLELTFDTGGAPLTVPDGGALKGFSIRATNGSFVPAQAQIKGNTITVWTETVDKPIDVRYGWDNWTEANLFNAQGFPAEPFRTDKDPLHSQGKY